MRDSSSGDGSLPPGLARGSLPPGLARGFTLIELLVVMGIIVILASISFPVMRSIQNRAKATATGATLDGLNLELEQYQSDFGDYPPTTLRDFGIKTNRINDGVESLLRCLTTTQQRGPYHEVKEEELLNTDDDEVSGNPTDSMIEADAAFEIGDPWGNPFVYFHSRDYEEAGKLGRYRTLDGRRIDAEPARSATTEQFQGFGKYQIWALGADGENQNGDPASDDVTSWK